MSIDRATRVEIIDGVKKSLPPEAVGSRNDPMARGTLLSALALCRALGLTKDEVLGTAKEEWLHLTEIDNRTVKGGK